MDTRDSSCGCKMNPKSLDDRCNTHALWECHKEDLPEGYPFIRNGKRCPTCFRSHIGSGLALNPAISQLTYERVRGHKPDMRGRENYE